MSDESGTAGAATASRARTRTAVGTAAFVLLCCALALALTAAVAGQEGDSGEPPGFGNATKGNLTTIQLTITDDTDVDESSIAARDFAVEPGTVADVSVNESGSDAVVELYLRQVLSSPNATVSIADGASINDAAGNALTEASVVVTGMDGYRPQLQDFAITRHNETTATVRVVSSEPLSQLYVGLGGPGTGTLSMANFTAIETPANFEEPYEATVTFPQEGGYDVVVGTMIDENGVTSRYNVERRVLVDHTAPVAAIGGPASTTVGEPVTFSGAASTDEHGIASYDWAIDGNATGSGESIERAFDTPGYHGVTLTVTDRRGNNHSTTVPILVDSEATTADVAVTATNASAATATVGPNRTTGRALLSLDGGLVSTGDVRLDSFAVDVPVNTSADLGFAAHENVSTWFDTANTTALAGLEVTHRRALSTATFRFSVDRSRLADAGLAPADVTLYREVDGWRPIYTTKVDEGDGWVTYEATAGGLSRFVVGGPGGGTEDADHESGGTGGSSADSTNQSSVDDVSPGGTSRILIENSTLLTAAIDPGDRAVVRAVAHNSGNASGTSVVGLVVDNSVVATTAVTVPPGENRTVTFAEPVEAGGSVVVNGTLAGTLTVGGNGTASTAGGGGLPIPNPLALWPGGLFGRALGAAFWFLAIVFVALKALAIYLGY